MSFMNMPCDPKFVMGAGSQFPLAVPILPIQKMQKQQNFQPPPQSRPGVKIEEPQTLPTTNKVETAKRQRKEERLMKNRESATQSRLRRKHEYENMKILVKELEEKIHSLENSLASSHTECKSLREQNAFLQDMIRKQFDVTHSSKGSPAEVASPEIEKALDQNNSNPPVKVVTGTLPRFVTEAGDKGASITGKKRGIDATSTPEQSSLTKKTPFVKISPGMMMTVAVMFCLASCLTPSSESTIESNAGIPYVGRNVLSSQSSNLTSMVDMWQFTANVLFNFVFLGVFGVGLNTMYTFFTSEGHLHFDANIRSMLPSFMYSMGKTKHS
jgi:hypothetical protein